MNIWMWRYGRGSPRMVSIAEAERIRPERLSESRTRAAETPLGWLAGGASAQEESLALPTAAARQGVELPALLRPRLAPPRGGAIGVGGVVAAAACIATTAASP